MENAVRVGVNIPFLKLSDLENTCLKKGAVEEVSQMKLRGAKDVSWGGGGRKKYQEIKDPNTGMSSVWLEENDESPEDWNVVSKEKTYTIRSERGKNWD